MWDKNGKETQIPRSPSEVKCTSDRTTKPWGAAMLTGANYAMGSKACFSITSSSRAMNCKLQNNRFFCQQLISCRIWGEEKRRF